MIIRFAGNSRPIEFKAARTRSLLSAIVLSGNPTILKAGMPDEICNCKSTSSVSNPLKAMVLTCACIQNSYHLGTVSPLRQRRVG